MTVGIIIYLFYAVISVWLISAEKRKWEEEEKGLAEWWMILAFVLPVAGFLAGYFMAKHHRSHKNTSFMDEYSQYIEKGVYNFDLLREQLEKDEDLLSVNLSGEQEGAGILKSIMLNLSNEKTIGHKVLLDKALSNSDRETVHYAAAIRNVLHERAVQQIDQEKRNLSSDSIAGYLSLMNSYRNYLDSGLYDTALKSDIEEEYGTFLKQALFSFPNQPEFLKAFGSLMLEKDLVTAEAAFKQALSSDQGSIDAEMGLFRAAYLKSDWPEIFRLAEKIYRHPQYQLLSEIDQQTAALFYTSRKTAEMK
ncbi:hypothetical protein LRR81_16050 [Metabacillus sp. GX 13764]|uniref:hypothetical protein n=1 Tax=Metabacillus kandeliae TaxID=2900151 RepID=UPI001E2B6725|nr:hypothetical protein [Metabacillus kandeliae]MCD7035757.1 hypothetical protein [Metabacillus kandeliae]